MGDKQSKSKKQTTNATQQQGRIMNDTKKILLLHKSSESQLKIVRYFKDALTTAANGSVRVTGMLNIAKESELSKDLSCLEEANNVVLICLTSEAIVQLDKILRAKRFTDENGNLHGKIFTISFGDSLASEWPPKGMKKSTSHARDFFFGFAEVEKLRPNDFEKSEKMTALVAAIKGAS